MPGDPGPLQAAREDHYAVVKLIQDLVRIPSRGGIDPYDPVLDCMASWLAGHGLPCRRLAFGGAKALLEHAPPGRVDGVMIGYPGLDHVVTGGRGVLRARLHVHGIAGHSGASKTLPSAIAKAAELISRLEKTRMHVAYLPAGNVDI